MFSFYPNRKVKDFVSNPPLPDLVQVEPLVVDGVITNHVRRVPQSNKPYLDGLIYDPSTMSLRALLNNGVKLSYIPNPSLDNDPIAVNNRINGIANAITSKYAELLSSSVDVESSKSE